MRRQLEEFLCETNSWLDRRRKKDPRRQYESQFAALATCVGQIGSALSERLGGIDSANRSDELYDRCRDLEQRLNWAQRFVGYYRERFDQRDDPRLSAALAAADEIVWSCHRRVYEVAEGHGTPLVSRPAPMPFFEYRYAPEIFPADVVPADLKGENFLAEAVAALPVPLLRLAASSASEPWSLAHIGHEIGHHIQFSVAPDAQAVRDFRDSLMAVANANSPADGKSWSAWATEVFADVFSIHAIGSAAVRAMAELELGTTMELPRGRYPPAVVRLHLLARAAERLCGTPPSAMAAPSTADAQRWCRQIDAVLDEAAGALVGPLGLADLCPPVLDGDLQAWADTLRQHGPGPPLAIDSARTLAGAGVVAWAGAIEAGEDLAALAQVLLERIRGSAPPGMRAAGSSAPLPTRVAERVAHAMLEVPLDAFQPDRWGA